MKAFAGGVLVVLGSWAFRPYGWLILAVAATVLYVQCFYWLYDRWLGGIEPQTRNPLGGSLSPGGTYQIDGEDDGIEIHSGPVPWNVNYWELDEQRPTGGGDRQTP